MYCLISTRQLPQHSKASSLAGQTTQFVTTCSQVQQKNAVSGSANKLCDLHRSLWLNNYYSYSMFHTTLPLPQAARWVLKCSNQG